MSGVIDDVDAYSTEVESESESESEEEEEERDQSWEEMIIWGITELNSR